MKIYVRRVQSGHQIDFTAPYKHCFDFEEAIFLVDYFFVLVIFYVLVENCQLFPIARSLGQFELFLE